MVSKSLRGRGGYIANTFVFQRLSTSVGQQHSVPLSSSGRNTLSGPIPFVTYSPILHAYMDISTFLCPRSSRGGYSGKLEIIHVI